MCLLRTDRPEDSVHIVQEYYERKAGMCSPRKMQVDVQPHEQENEGRTNTRAVTMRLGVLRGSDVMKTIIDVAKYGQMISEWIESVT